MFFNKKFIYVNLKVVSTISVENWSKIEYNTLIAKRGYQVIQGKK